MKNNQTILFLFAIVFAWSFNLYANPEQKDYRLQCEIERLRELKENDPGQYEHELDRYRKKLDRKLQKLKEKNPEKYREIHEKLIQRQHRQYRKEFENRPEDRRKQFYDAYTNRLYERVLHLKKHDPEKYERLKKKVLCRREELIEHGKPPPPSFFFEDRSGIEYRPGMHQPPPEFDDGIKNRKPRYKVNKNRDIAPEQHKNRKQRRLNDRDKSQTENNTPGASAANKKKAQRKKVQKQRDYQNNIKSDDIKPSEESDKINNPEDNGL